MPGLFWVSRGFDDDLALFCPDPYASINAWYRFPAGTYDALMEALPRNGAFSLSPGEGARATRSTLFFPRVADSRPAVKNRSPRAACGPRNDMVWDAKTLPRDFPRER